MKCPHCLDGIHEGWENATSLGGDAESDGWRIQTMRCPECARLIVRLEHLDESRGWATEIVRPRAIARSAVPGEVPPKYAGDYREACLVLQDSPKASAALSRRCLQHLLRDEGKVNPGNLSDEIDQAMATLPSHLSDAIDAVRNIGNFAAHPMKSTQTGEIVDVEPGEAEWLLDVLEGLFDFYFVQPKLLAQKRAALDQKLQEAGKPPMK